MKDSYDHGLKLFLNSDDLERLYDFEEECMEGLAREREAKLQLSTEERVRVIGERLDGMGSKIEDSFQKSVIQNQSLQSLDFRMMRLEELSEQTIASLAVIHRFMAFQTSDKNDDSGKSKSRDKTKSSLNLDIDMADVTPEEFRKHLSAPSERLGRRSSCAFEPENPEPEEPIRAVEAQDLAMLRAMGPVARFGRTSQRTYSETSNDAAHILQSMEDSAMALGNSGYVRTIAQRDSPLSPQVCPSF